MTEPSAPEIVGVWRLLEYGDRASEADPWTLTFGERPTGVAVYHRSGLLSMQVFPDGPGPEGMSHVAYCGTWVVREARRAGDAITGVVEHLMQAASHSELLTEDPARLFTVENDRLLLGDDRTWKRVFERLI